MMVKGELLIKYLLKKTGCIHPFRLSRILALAELDSLDSTGKRITNLRYVSGPGVFYIDGLKELVESDECIIKREGDPERGVRGCIELVCGEDIEIDSDVSNFVDRAIQKASGLNDMELNEAVMSHPKFKELTS